MKYNVNVQYTIEVDVPDAHEAANQGTQCARWGADGRTIANLNVGVAQFDYGLGQVSKLEAEKTKEIPS